MTHAIDAQHAATRELATATALHDAAESAYDAALARFAADGELGDLRARLVVAEARLAAARREARKAGV